jgi:hypothetical protein
MKASKVMEAFPLLCAIGYFLWPFFHPWLGVPNLYNRFLVLTGVFVTTLGYWCPGFKAFARALPLAFRLLLASFLVFLAFMDIKTSGFTGFTLFALSYTLVWLLFLFSRKPNIP